MMAKYTVNEVEERTSVPASTLRQWERRYGFPMPARSDSGYRLYSDLDLEQIEAMKRYIADGVPASRAALLVKNAKRSVTEAKSTKTLSLELLSALIELNDAKADAVLSEAYALHTVENVLMDIIRPAMFELGEMWHTAAINTTTEHFASSYVLGKLRGLFSLASSNQNAASIIIACAPGDQHELGALMLAVILRRKAFRVYYIGANTPVYDLASMATEMMPQVVMVSASIAGSLSALFEEKARFKSMAPIVVFGGPAFDENPDLARDLGGHYLSADLEEAAEGLVKLLEQKGVKA